MIELKPFPIRYEELNHLYEHTDQSCCLNRLSVPLDEGMSRNFFLAVRTGVNNGMPFLCQGIYWEGRLIGKIELTRYEDGSAELDLVLEHEYTGRHFGTEALEAMRKLAEEKNFCTHLCAYVHEDNRAMRRVLEKNGFTEYRTFQADVAGPWGKDYRLVSVTGKEYLRPLRRN